MRNWLRARHGDPPSGKPEALCWQFSHAQAGRAQRVGQSPGDFTGTLHEQMAPGDFTAHQAQLLYQAQAIFIFQQLIIFPLYFAPGLRGRLGGDVRPKFPCSISWMIRKGAPRVCTLLFWNAGWLLMMRAFFKDGHATSMSATDWARAAFMLQMYATYPV